MKYEGEFSPKNQSNPIKIYCASLLIEFDDNIAKSRYENGKYALLSSGNSTTNSPVSLLCITNVEGTHNF